LHVLPTFATGAARCYIEHQNIDMPMKILLTNDDGVRAPGIVTLAEEMKSLGRVVVVAPATQQSAVSHSITLHKPLRCVEEPDFPVEGVEAWSTNGTPTDAVLLGIHAIFREKPDVIISGINSGPNLGADVTYSGTVAGAMEGVVAHVPSIAASMGAFEKLEYSDCARFVKHIARIVGSGCFPSDVLLNINYPNLPPDEIKGIAITKLGLRWYEDVIHERVDPRGRKYYWITGKKVLFGREAGTDAFELERGYISVTPLTLDMTRTPLMEKVAEILSNPSEAGVEDFKLPYEVTGPAIAK
jgi:5'-nucleotidase